MAHWIHTRIPEPVMRLSRPTSNSAESKRWFSIPLPLLILAMALPSMAGAQWTEPPREGWASLSVYHQDTREVFGVEGDRTIFPGRGRSVVTAAYLTLASGLADGVDAWIQLPAQRLRFDDVTGDETRSGIGDIRVYLRARPLEMAGSPIPVALRVGVKLPVGDFDVGSGLIPLGDGQRDWEVIVEGGHSFHPHPLYAMGWVGYRWREALEPGRTEFGNERFFHAALGGEAGRLGFRLAADGWFGGTPLLNALRARGAEREILRLAPSLLVGWGPGQVEVGARRPFRGRNLPAGTDLVLGYFTRYGF
ncbi:MAG: hypothetical protein EA421_02950 [Gemmatimonadales bacterium]|nr:MAG: hypothetical protein EA421_02950 [Gemmatimonadales bacterium]